MFVLTVVFYTRNCRLDDYFTHLDLFVKYSTNIIGLVDNRNKDLYFMEIKSELSSLTVVVIIVLFSSMILYEKWINKYLNTHNPVVVE